MRTWLPPRSSTIGWSALCQKRMAVSWDDKEHLRRPSVEECHCGTGRKVSLGSYDERVGGGHRAQRVHRGVLCGGGWLGFCRRQCRDVAAMPHLPAWSSMRIGRVLRSTAKPPTIGIRCSSTCGALRAPQQRRDQYDPAKAQNGLTLYTSGPRPEGAADRHARRRRARVGPALQPSLGQAPRR